MVTIHEPISFQPDDFDKVDPMYILVFKFGEAIFCTLSIHLGDDNSRRLIDVLKLGYGCKVH